MIRARRDAVLEVRGAPRERGHVCAAIAFRFPRRARQWYGEAVSEIIHSAEFESAIGLVRVVSSERGLAYVGLPLVNGRGFMGWLQSHGAGAQVSNNFAINRRAIGQLSDFINGKREVLDLPLDLRATDFQRRIYEVVAKISYGETLTYAEVAASAGCADSVRAVGAALGANPLPLVIPCHRVLSGSGKLRGYAGALEIKARLLTAESAGPTSGRLL